MISKKEKIMWFVYGMILILLFLMSSTELIIKEQENPVYPISIVVEEASDENYVNFRKGMDRAAIELNADVRFVTLYDSNDPVQQINMAVREQQEGARAIILAPVNELEVESALTDKRVTAPLVLFGAELPLDRIAAVVTVDYYEMGQMLGMQVAEKQTASCPVYLFRSGGENTVKRRFEDGIRSVLEPAGYELRMIAGDDKELFRKTIEELVYPGREKALIIALDQKSLSEAADILADSTVYSSQVIGLYGRGTSSPILNYLDRGIITGLCVTDDFSAGYLCVGTAVEAVTNPGMGQQTMLDSFYIERGDLRESKYEKMLYPIE